MSRMQVTHTLDEIVLKNVQKIKTLESRPSQSNTIEMLLKKGIEAWTAGQNVFPPIKKKVQ